MSSLFFNLNSIINMNNFILVLLCLFLGACNASEATDTSKSVTNQVAEAVPTATKTTPTTSKDTSPAESPDIRIQIDGAQAGPVRLIGIYTDRQYLADSAKIDANGLLHIKRTEPFKEGLLYAALQTGGAVQMLLTKDQTFSMKTHISDLVGAMEVAGSVDNEVFYQSLKMESVNQGTISSLGQQMKGMAEDNPQFITLKQQRDKLLAERKANLDKLFKQYPNSLFTSFKRAGQNPPIRDIRFPDGTLNEVARVHAYRTEFWDNVDFSDERLLHTPVIANKLKRYITELTPQHPDSIISAASFLVDKSLPYPTYFQYFANWITVKYDPKETTLMDPQAVYSFMVQNYFTEERAFWSNPAEVQALQTRAYEMAQSLVGQQGPDVISTDQYGKQQSIYEKTAPYIIVYMYNPDCEHCQEQTPKLVQFYNQWKSKGVDVYAIAIDTDDASWKDYIQKIGMTFTNVHDPTNRSIYAKYYVDQTPELYVLNPQRKIIGKNLKVNQVEIIINRDKNGG